MGAFITIKAYILATKIRQKAQATCVVLAYPLPDFIARTGTFLTAITTSMVQD
jgi:hypothetical protein